MERHEEKGTMVLNFLLIAGGLIIASIAGMWTLRPAPQNSHFWITGTYSK